MKAICVWERFALTPKECGRKILKGGACNKPIVLVRAMARVMWWLARMSPSFVMNFARMDFAKWRNKARDGNG